MSRSNQVKEQRVITDRQKLMGFGKYALESVQDVIDNDPQYLLWLDSTTDIQIASSILSEAEDNSRPDHLFKGYTQRDIKNFK